MISTLLLHFFFMQQDMSPAGYAYYIPKHVLLPTSSFPFSGLKALLNKGNMILKIARSDEVGSVQQQYRMVALIQFPVMHICHPRCAVFTSFLSFIFPFFAH